MQPGPYQYEQYIGRHGGRPLRLCPINGRYLRDGRWKRYGGSRERQYLMLLHDSEMVWVTQAALEDRARVWSEPHWEANMRLVDGWTDSGRLIPFIDWIAQEGYRLNEEDHFVHVNQDVNNNPQDANDVHIVSDYEDSEETNSVE
jgi:hypothetical protein